MAAIETKPMKHSYLITFFSILAFPITIFAQSDTLSLEQYLNLFSNPFINNINLCQDLIKNSEKINLSFSKEKWLYKKVIFLNNGKVLNPELSGWAFSYKKINDSILWLLHYRETEGGGGTIMLLSILNKSNLTITKTYNLAYCTGDQGDYAYKYGKWINDSTFKYMSVSYSYDANLLKKENCTVQIGINGAIKTLKRKCVDKKLQPTNR